MKKLLVLLIFISGSFVISIAQTNCSSKSRVLRIVPEDKKKVLLIESFKNNSTEGKKWDPWRLGLSSMIQDDLVSVGYFKVISADARNKALKEIAFTRSGLTQDKVIDLGRMLGADWLFLGDFLVFQGTLNINVRVIETATARVIASSGKTGALNQFFNISKGASIALLGQFKFDLTENEVAVIKKQIETKNIEASLSNYSGEQLMRKVAVLEQQKKVQDANQKEIDQKINSIKAIAKNKFRNALNGDPDYKKAENNLNKMTLMLPSSI